MIKLHCTQKLLAKLPLHEDGRLRSKNPEAIVNDNKPSLLSGWHANLILLQRRQCVLFVHDLTRFPLFVPALKKNDFAELDYWFIDTFMNTLLTTGANSAMMDCAQSALAPLVCDNERNRSVQGTLNQMKQDVDYMLRYDGIQLMDLSVYRTSSWLADRPCSAKGIKDCIWPVREMHTLLSRPNEMLN